MAYFFYPPEVFEMSKFILPLHYDDNEVDIIDLRQLRSRIKEITDNIDNYKDYDKDNRDCEKLFDEC